jgi:hypothetical protein
VAWFKDRTPKEVIDRARRMEIKDNSIGFTCFNDPTPGEFQGQHYDVVQRNIFIDHLAAPIEKGRCPSPYCGINADSVEDLEKPVITVQDADLGISYVFDKSKFTDEQAKVWVEKRTVKDCPVCTRMLEAGLLVAGQRLYKQYGVDVLEVIEGHKLPPKDASPSPPATIDTQDSKDDVILKNRQALKDLYSLTEIFT